MAKIPISRSEFTKGWTRARAAYIDASTPKNNANRLLLFYAVENGLKAFIMRLERLHDGAEGFEAEVHDINKLLSRAKAEASLLLPLSVRIKENQSSGPRNCAVGQINQMWRYGCMAEIPTDDTLEQCLNRVAQWIEENI